ncbi:MAG: hypothetical protein ACK515_06910 [bacterium]|jgi:hypothetical protein|nr:hypothetical protein [Betaproteobacteria bacterium]
MSFLKKSAVVVVSMLVMPLAWAQSAPPVDQKKREDRREVREGRGEVRRDARDDRRDARDGRRELRNEYGGGNGGNRTARPARN